jgi:hypothetical protein
MDISDNSILMKSKERVQKHGEVFTPQWVVDKMLAIPGIKEKTADVFATFLEPSAGEGAFLLAIENLKLQSVTANHAGNEWNVNALWALSSIYGIEFLEDNLKIARKNMLDLFLSHYQAAHGDSLSKKTNLYQSAKTIIRANIVQGNTLTHKNSYDEEIVFSHWELVQGTTRKVQRTQFTYSSLFPDSKQSEGDYTQLHMFETVEQLSLFDILNEMEGKEQMAQKYSVVDIEQIWKEEKEYVGSIQI